MRLVQGDIRHGCTGYHARVSRRELRLHRTRCRHGARAEQRADRAAAQRAGRAARGCVARGNHRHGIAHRPVRLCREQPDRLAVERHAREYRSRYRRERLVADAAVRRRVRAGQHRQHQHRAQRRPGQCKPARPGGEAHAHPDGRPPDATVQSRRLGRSEHHSGSADRDDRGHHRRRIDHLWLGCDRGRGQFPPAPRLQGHRAQWPDRRQQLWRRQHLSHHRHRRLRLRRQSRPRRAVVRLYPSRPRAAGRARLLYLPHHHSRAQHHPAGQCAVRRQPADARRGQCGVRGAVRNAGADRQCGRALYRADRLQHRPDAVQQRGRPRAQLP